MNTVFEPNLHLLIGLGVQSLPVVSGEGHEGENVRSRTSEKRGVPSDTVRHYTKIGMLKP